MFSEEDIRGFLAGDRYIRRQIAKRGIIIRRPGEPDRIQESTINKKHGHKNKKKKEEKEAKNVAVAAADDSSHESDSDEKKNATVAKKVETSDEEKADSSDESSKEESSSEPLKKKAKANESSEEEEESSSDDEESDSEDEDEDEGEDEANTATVEVKQTYVVGVFGFNDLDDIDKIRDALKEHFAHCGKISYMSVPKDHKTGRSTGSAFMDFGNIEAYNKAKQMNRSEVLGGQIFVVKAYPRKVT